MEKRGFHFLKQDRDGCQSAFGPCELRLHIRFKDIIRWAAGKGIGH